MRMAGSIHPEFDTVADGMGTARCDYGGFTATLAA
jgi:hypothetical protein